jgi:hypothetical protein
MYTFQPSQEQPPIQFYEDSQTEAFLTNQAKEYLPPIPSRRLPGYDRDSLATGVDIKLNPGDDLAVNPNGDLELETGSELVQNALARRLATPPRGYRRYVFTGDSVVLLDETYGNPVYSLLSQPSTHHQEEAITSLIKEAAQREPRVSKVTIKTLYLADRGNRMVVQLHYQIKSNDELYQLDLEFNGG